MVPAKSLNGKWLIVLGVGAVVISLAFVGVTFVALSPSQGGTMYGTLFVNAGGYSNSTVGATGSYNVTLTAKNGEGQVLFTFLSGTDLVKNDLLTFSNYTITVNQISMTIGGHAIVMPWEDNDTVWAGEYNNNYIASWGPSAPAYEMRGTLSPSTFGLPANDYVEFRFQALGGEPSDDCC